MVIDPHQFSETKGGLDDNSDDDDDGGEGETAEGHREAGKDTKEKSKSKSKSTHLDFAPLAPASV